MLDFPPSQALPPSQAAGPAARGTAPCPRGRAVLLAQHERAVGTAVDARCAGDSVKLVVRRRLSRVVDDEQAEPKLVRKLFELADDLVVVPVAMATRSRPSTGPSARSR